MARQICNAATQMQWSYLQYRVYTVLRVTQCCCTGQGSTVLKQIIELQPCELLWAIAKSCVFEKELG